MRVLLLGAAALTFCAPAGGEEPQQDASKAAADAGTVARIFASWKDRRERTKSFHFVWETHAVRHGAAVDNVPPLARSHCEFWFDGDSRYRFEESTELPPGTNGSRGRKQWTAFDGKLYSFLTWTEGSPLTARGKLWSFPALILDFLNGKERALLLVYRADRRAGQYVLNTENATVDGVHYIKLRRAGEPGKPPESLWVDPRQGNVPVVWEMALPGGRQLPPVSVQYRSDKERGWIPIGWRMGSPDGRPLDLVSTVKTFAINEALPSNTFQIEFPPGTAVSVDLGKNRQEQYVVNPDGSKDICFDLQSIHSPLLRTVLEQHVEFTIEPEPLRDAISFIKTRYGIQIVLEGRAFRDAKIESRTVSSEDPGIRLWEVLGRLSAQCPTPFRVVERGDTLVLVPRSPAKPATGAKSQPVATPNTR